MEVTEPGKVNSVVKDSAQKVIVEFSMKVDLLVTKEIAKIFRSRFPESIAISTPFLTKKSVPF